MGSTLTVEALTLPLIALLWTLVLLRARGALYGGSRRLAAILLALATILTIRLSFVGQVIDDVTGVVGLQVLTRDSLGIVMAVCALLVVADVVTPQAVGPWLVRTCSLVAVAAIVAMTVAFAAVGPERHGVLHMGPESGQTAAFTYWSIYTLTYGGFIGAVAIMAAIEARRPGPWTQGRRGLVLFGIGALFTDVYLAAKAVVLVAARLGHHDHPFVANASAVQAVPSAVAILFIVLGAASWAQLNLRARWLHRRLRDPWAALTGHVPAVVLDPPLRNPQARLNRRVHEIHEAARLVLTHASPQDVTAAATPAAAVAPGVVLLELARRRTAQLGLDAAPGTSAAQVDLPTDPAALAHVFRRRRQAQRLAARIASDPVLEPAP